MITDGKKKKKIFLSMPIIDNFFIFFIFFQ